MRSGKLLILCINQKKSLKKYTITKLSQQNRITFNYKNGYSENSKTSETHVLILKLIDKSDLRRGEKSIALSNLSIYYAWENLKSSCDNNKFKTSAPMWNDIFELPDGL